MVKFIILEIFISFSIFNLLNENQKLKKNNKNIFAQNIKLDNDILELKGKIIEQQNQIDTYLEEIKKLKDQSLHGS